MAIIESLLDLDMYKFFMMQVVLHKLVGFYIEFALFSIVIHVQELMLGYYL